GAPAVLEPVVHPRLDDGQRRRVRRGRRGAGRGASRAAGRLGVVARRRAPRVRATRGRGALRQSRRSRRVTEAARYTADEETAIRAAAAAGQTPTCPRDGTAMTARSIG